jgi:hypothetical protein
MLKPTSLLRDLVGQAESRFGARSNRWSIFVALNPDRGSPFTAPCLDQNSIFVLLPEDVVGNYEQMRFQLAHESVHCLEPSKDALRALRKESRLCSASLRAASLLHTLKARRTLFQMGTAMP